jgi:predicted DNA-binding transcriptional regulator YafY
MLETSARLLRLLSLLQARSTWTGRDLVERLEVTDRTLRRDVDRLRDLGYPVHSTSGPAGGYRLGAGAELPPLMLEDDESLAVALGVASISSGPLRGVREAADRAMAKLEQVMPVRLRRRLRALQRAIVHAPHGGPAVALGTVAALGAACVEAKVARFGYRDRGGAATARAVEPLGLVLYERRWYLAAWDRGREGFRTFRVDRMEGEIALGERFTPRALPDDDAQTYVARSVSSVARPIEARIVFDAPAAVVGARIPTRFGAVEGLSARTCRWVTRASSLDDVAWWAATLDVPFAVESPPELAERLSDLGQRLVAAAKRRPSALD